MLHIATQPSYARRGTAGLGRLAVGEPISAIPIALRAILPTGVCAPTRRPLRFSGVFVPLKRPISTLQAFGTDCSAMRIARDKRVFRLQAISNKALYALLLLPPGAAWIQAGYRPQFGTATLPPLFCPSEQYLCVPYSIVGRFS